MYSVIHVDELLARCHAHMHIYIYNNSACNGHLYQIVQEIKVLSTLDDVSDDGIFELRAMGGGARRVTSGVTPPPSQLSEPRQRRFHSLVRWYITHKHLYDTITNTHTHTHMHMYTTPLQTA